MDQYRHVQAKARRVLASLASFINAESTEQSIAERAVELMVESGIKNTWYYDTPALVLLGSRSCHSVSGKDYKPTVEAAGQTNLVTVDISPMAGGAWGDCARSFCIENGQYVSEPRTSEFRHGLATEHDLHRRMMEFVTPETLFSELYEFGNSLINELGYENLDFLGNLGHSIEISLTHRRYIDAQCHEPLASVRLFTFEPHIRRMGDRWGFKHEEMYYFDDTGQARCI